MQKFNYHTHTYRCGHTENNVSDEDFIKLFIKKGFHKVAFTDHCPEKDIIDYRKNIRMKYNEKDEYLNNIKILKEKYKEIIDIETGFEVEYLPGNEQYLLELKNQTDKIILGQHFIYDNNKNLKIIKVNDFSDEDLLKYSEYIKSAMENKIPDIIAHPDLYTINRKEFGDIEKTVAHIICSIAEENSIPIEINLSEPILYLVGKINKITSPHKEFWKIATEYKKLKVVYGIDAHYQNQIELYENALELVKEHIGHEIIDELNFCNDNLEID